MGNILSIRKQKGSSELLPVTMFDVAMFEPLHKVELDEEIWALQV